MLENKKRDQHYVFQAYLKNWVNTNGKLWCMRDGKVFDVKTSNIAFEKDFYRVNSLSNKDIEFIKLFFYKSSDAFKKEMDYFLKLYTTIDRDEKIFVSMDLNFNDEAIEFVVLLELLKDFCNIKACDVLKLDKAISLFTDRYSDELFEKIIAVGDISAYRGYKTVELL